MFLVLRIATASLWAVFVVGVRVIFDRRSLAFRDSGALCIAGAIRNIVIDRPSYASRYDRYADAVQIPEVGIIADVDPEASISFVAPRRNSWVE